MTAFTLPNLPTALNWINSPLEWKADPNFGLTITAGSETDWFIDPGSSYNKDNAPAAVFSPPDTQFALSAKVKVAFGSTYDAATLQVREGDRLWGKLCFEYSPQGKPMVVSVVTREVSDDCNSTIIDSNEVYLRVYRNEQTFAFHYSIDGHYWNFVRYFTLGALSNLRVGFSAQSPTGQQCRVEFSEIAYVAQALTDLRNGD